MFKEFDAENVREEERFSYWHEEMCRNFCRAESKPVKRRDPFHARLSCSQLGSIQVSSIDCSPLRYQRVADDVRASPSDEFLLSVLRGGSGRIEQQGRLTEQAVGDVVIYDTARPFVYEFHDRYQMVLLKIPRRAMLARVPEAERLTALRISGQTPLGGLAATMITNAAALNLQDGPAAAKVGASIIDVLAAAMDVQFADSGRTADRQAGLLSRAKVFIRSNLDDPELNVEGIATALCVSSSTLARLFASSGTTVMRWLWEERLAASHLALVEGRAKQVTEVALACGFSSFSHFSRSFKARYGHTPNALIRGARSSAAH